MAGDGQMMQLGGVYVITSPSGGQYVGSTVHFAKRWLRHRRRLIRGDHHSAPLQAAWNKYGDSLALAPLLVCRPADLLMYEQAVMDQFNPRYNVRRGASNAYGRPQSQATKDKLRAANLGKKLSPEHIEKMAAAHRGKKIPAEIVARTRFTGKTHTAETKAKIGIKAVISNERRRKA